MDNLNIFDGYIELGILKFKTDQEKSIKLITIGVQNIQKYYGDETLIEKVKFYELSKLGFSLKQF